MFEFNIPGIGPVAFEARSRGEAIKLLEAWVQRVGYSPETRGFVTAAFNPVQLPEGSSGNGIVVKRFSGDGLQEFGEPLTRPSDGSGGVTVPENIPAGEVGAPNVPGVDVNAFPFASFANALQDSRGLDVNGVQGATLGNLGNELIRGADIGALTGTIDPFGDTAGAQQNFFRDQLGTNNTLSQRAFNDLRSGLGAEGLNAEDSLALKNLRAPALGTEAGNQGFSAVSNLARDAATGKFGAFGQRFLPSNAQLTQAFQRPLAQGQSPNFLDFIAGQFGV